MVLWLLLFLPLTWAQERATNKFCFSSEASLQKTLIQLKTALVPSDKIETNDQCLTITMNEHRQDLLKNYVRKISPSVQIAEDKPSPEPCRLKVEKVGVIAKDTNQLKLSDGLVANETESKEETLETMQIQTLNDFELQVGQESIKGRCRLITPFRYEITLIVKKDPKPIIPPGLPPGTIVSVPSPPPDQDTLFLQTQVQLVQGQKIEVGSIVKELKNKDRNVSATPEINLPEANKYSSEKVFLSLE